MTIRISDKHDAMVLQMLAGQNLSAANRDTFLQNMKTWLDANVSMFKDGNGNYTVPHVIEAFNIVRNRGK